MGSSSRMAAIRTSSSISPPSNAQGCPRSTRTRPWNTTLSRAAARRRRKTSSSRYPRASQMRERGIASRPETTTRQYDLQTLRVWWITSDFVTVCEGAMIHPRPRPGDFRFRQRAAFFHPAAALFDQRRDQEVAGASADTGAAELAIQLDAAIGQQPQGLRVDPMLDLKDSLRQRLGGVVIADGDSPLHHDWPCVG